MVKIKVITHGLKHYNIDRDTLQCPECSSHTIDMEWQDDGIILGICEYCFCEFEIEVRKDEQSTDFEKDNKSLIDIDHCPCNVCKQLRSHYFCEFCNPCEIYKDKKICGEDL